MSFLDVLSQRDIVDGDIIKSLFLDYEERKKSRNLYSKEDYVPQNLIKIYFASQEQLDFSQIVYNFKRKYIYNENELENVKVKEERDGLGKVYDYIKNSENDTCPNIYVILLLHTLLYSKVPYPEFGGKFRVTEAMISGSNVRTTSPGLIAGEIAALYKRYQDLLEASEKIMNTKNKDYLLAYIDECVELKCRLIEIHPFPDGNGRTFRALVNLLFRKIGLPPVYVKNSERKEYIEAMDYAIRLKDTSGIKKFYYYKICDSIVELDIKERVNKEKQEELKLVLSPNQRKEKTNKK